MAFMFISVIAGPFLVALLSFMVALAIFQNKPKRAIVIMGAAAVLAGGGAVLFAQEDLGMNMMIGACIVLLLFVFGQGKAAPQTAGTPPNAANGLAWLVLADLILLVVLLVALAMLSSFKWSI